MSTWHFKNDKNRWKQVAVALPPEAHKLINALRDYLDDSFKTKDVTKSFVIRDLIKIGLMVALDEMATNKTQLDEAKKETFLSSYKTLKENGWITDEKEEDFLSRYERLKGNNTASDEEIKVTPWVRSSRYSGRYS